MSIHTAPFKDPNYILLNPRESNAINPHKQQGLNCSGDMFCQVCNRPLKYLNQQLCHLCKGHLIRGTLFEEYGELRVYGDEYKECLTMVSDEVVNRINIIMKGKFKTRTYKAKTAKMIYIMMRYINASGNIEPDLAYRRLRYHANSSQRDSLQATLQSGKKLFNILFSYLYKNVNH